MRPGEYLTKDLPEPEPPKRLATPWWLIGTIFAVIVLLTWANL